jgi:hypothetical protein
MTAEQFRYPRRSGRRQADVHVHLAIFVFVIAGMTLLNWILSPSFWWVAFPAIGWGIGLGAHAISVFFEDAVLGEAWEERKTRELIEYERRGTG